MVPNCLRSPALRLVTVITTALVVLCATPHAVAADILVFTDSRHPVQGAAGSRVVELDLPERIERDWSRGLGSDPAAATAAAQQRLHDGGEALQRRIAAAYQGVTDAWSLGIKTLPAVVVDRRYVVYGDADVARAVARIAAYRKAHP